MANEITQYLPACYRQGNEQEEIVTALTQGAADKYAELKQLLETYEQDYLDPDTCKESWLDILAHWSGWGALWSASWKVEDKRALIKQSNYLWENRGNKDTLALLFQIFGLTVELAPQSGFILGTTLFPGGLGIDPFDYIVKVPTTYTDGSPELMTVRRLLKDFCPCWVNLSIQRG